MEDEIEEKFRIRLSLLLSRKLLDGEMRENPKLTSIKPISNHRRILQYVVSSSTKMKNADIYITISTFTSVRPCGVGTASITHHRFFTFIVPGASSDQ